MLVVKNLTRQTFTINTIKYRTLGPKQTIEIESNEFVSNAVLQKLEANKNIMVYQKPITIETSQVPSAEKNTNLSEQMENIENLVSSPKKRGRKKKNK